MKIIIIILSVLMATQSWAMESDDIASAEQELKAYFFAAARMNDVVVLNEFVDAGFPINVTNEQGYTALMVATYHGNIEAFDYLVSQKASTCAVDNKGNTALMAAIFRGEFSLAKKLISYECDSKHKNMAGNDAVNFAEVFGRDDMLKLLNK